MAAGVPYWNFVVDKQGNAIQGASVAILADNANTSTQPGSPLAAIFSDENLTQPLANPIITDANGRFLFFIAPGTYIAQVYATNATLSAVFQTYLINFAVGSLQNHPVQQVAGTSYTILDADRGKILRFTNGGAISVSIAQAGASSQFTNGWFVDLLSLSGTGTITITPTTSQIQGGATYQLKSNSAARLASDGTNYWVESGGNATSIQGIPVSSTAPTIQQVLEYNVNTGQWTPTLTDGIIHGDPVWWNDSGFVTLKDDFITIPGNINTSTTSIGDHGWWNLYGTGGQVGGKEGALGGLPPYLGQYAWNANSATSNVVACLAFTGSNVSGIESQMSWALLDNPGWKSSFVFKVSGAALTSPEVFNTNSKALYVGFMGPLSLSGLSNGNGGRPNQFIGIRYDTSTTPAAFKVSSVAAASGGNTVYTGTFTGGASNAFAGQTITFKNFVNNVNNGTFTISASTATTVTVNNAAGVVETPSLYIAVGVMPSIILSAAAAASGGNTVYTYVNSANYPTNAFLGMTFVVTGFTNSVNNGTFTCVASGATSLTLNNAAGVAETHQGFAAGESCNDAFFTLEVVNNVTNAAGFSALTTSQRMNHQGSKFVTNVAPTVGTWHRLDIVCTAAGQVTLTLDGSGTNTLTASMPVSSLIATGVSAISATSNGTAGLLSWAASTIGNGPWNTGSKLTMSGWTGGATGFNGTFEFLWMGNGQGEFLTTTNITTSNSNAVTVTGNPSLTPVFCMGADDTQGGQLVQSMRFYADYWSLAWNPAIISQPQTPNPALPRYF